MYNVDYLHFAECYPNLFTIILHHSGRLTSPPGRKYVAGKIDHVDLIDIDQFSIHEVGLMMDCLGYNGTQAMYYMYLYPGKNLDNGLEDLSSDQDCRELAKHVEMHKFIDVYVTHGLNNIKELLLSPTKCKPALTIEEIDEPGSFAIVPSKLRFYEGQSSKAGEQSGIDEMFSQVQDNVNVEIVDDLLFTENDGHQNIDGEQSGIDDMISQVFDLPFTENDEQNHESDSDYIVDADNNIDEPEVDMSDYRMHIDPELEDTISNEPKGDPELDVIDNEKFESGSDSD